VKEKAAVIIGFAVVLVGSIIAWAIYSSSKQVAAAASQAGTNAGAGAINQAFANLGLGNLNL